MASISRRGDKWRVRVTKLGFPSLSKTFTNRVDAEKWARSTESECERGSYQDERPAQKIILKEALDRYENEVSKFKRSHNVERYYIQSWRSSAVANLALAYIQPSHLAEYRDQRLEKGLATSSVRNELGLISHLFTVAQKDWGLISLKNPVRQMRLPKAKPGRERRVSDQEIAALCDVVRPELRDCILLALHTAMRKSEILGLRRSDIDFDRRIAYLDLTKNGEKRDVPLSSTALLIFQKIPATNEENIFTLTTWNLSHLFKDGVEVARKNYIKQGGTNNRFLHDLHFHDLRHEAASRLVEKGFHPLEVMAITGHKDTKMLKRYVHPRAESLALKLG